ncbi:MAG: hypothetical protein J6U54_03600 [Clostridiales bacterium]|nr:hypothetical protein [Clostridiales bacterium]
MSTNEEFFKEELKKMLNELPDDFREGLMKIMLAKADMEVGDPVKRESIRRDLIKSGNTESLEGFMTACHMYDTNKCAVQTLGNIKQMLSRFDEHNTSTANLIENLKLIRHISMVIGLATNSIGNSIKEFTGDMNDLAGKTPS